jgi:hypothetical protein
VSAHSRRRFVKMEQGKRRRGDVVLLANLKGGGDLVLQFDFSWVWEDGTQWHMVRRREPKGRQWLGCPEEGDNPLSGPAGLNWATGTWAGVRNFQ